MTFSCEVCNGSKVPDSTADDRNGEEAMQEDRPKQMDQTEANISIMDQDGETLEEGDETIQEWKSRYIINGEFFSLFSIHLF